MSLFWGVNGSVFELVFFFACGDHAMTSMEFVCRTVILPTFSVCVELILHVLWSLVVCYARVVVKFWFCLLFHVTEELHGVYCIRLNVVLVVFWCGT